MEFFTWNKNQHDGSQDQRKVVWPLQSGSIFLSILVLMQELEGSMERVSSRSEPSNGGYSANFWMLYINCMETEKFLSGRDIVLTSLGH